MVEKDSKKRGRSSSSSSSSSSGSGSSSSSGSGSSSGSNSRSGSSDSSRSRSRSPRRRENRPARGGARSRSPIRRGSPPRGARADRGGGNRPSPSPPRRRRVSPSPPRRRDRSGSRQRRRSPPVGRRSSPAARSASPKIKRVIIRNLSRNVLRTHVEEIFSIYGTIAKVDLPSDRNHAHLHRGYGYVDYENMEDAEKSIKHMDGGQIDGQIVQVEMTVGRQFQSAPPRRQMMSPIRRRPSPPPRDRGDRGGDRDRKSPIRRGGGRSPPPRRRSPMGGVRGSGANTMPLGPSRFRRGGSRSRSPIGRGRRSPS